MEPSCQRYLRGSEGLFCANFFAKQGYFAPCLSCWCPAHYGPLGGVEFPVATQYDEDGEVIMLERDANRFQEARAGGHLMTPFQWETCHSEIYTGATKTETS
jgi:hypothetical protein